MVKLRKSNSLVKGFGTKGVDYPSKTGKIILKEYSLWRSMLERCTEKCWSISPAYIGTTCSENFKSYSFFYEWCQQQVGFLSKDDKGNCWQLDKDLLVKGNKIYSEDACVFVPSRINKLLTKCDNARGKYPLGVYLCKQTNKFVASCRNNSNSICLGFFFTPDEAFQAYKTYKEALIKQIANEYRSQLDPRAYDALLNYTVEITD